MAIGAVLVQPQQQQPGAASPRATSFPYILGPASDLFFLGPGVTLLVSAVFIALFASGRDAVAGLLVTSLSIAFSGPHYAATYRRAYSSREIIRSHPLVTLLAPVLLVITAAVSLRFPATVAPLFFLLYVIWSGYHYSGQSLGLALLYPLRQGHRLDVGEKRLLAFPLYVSWMLSLVGLLRLDSSPRNPAYGLVRDAILGHLALPSLSSPWVLAAGVALLVASFSSVALLAVRRRRRGVPLPWPVYGVILAQAIWFGWGLFYPLFNIVLVPIFHGLQYLALTSWHQCKGRGAAGPRAFAVYAATVLLLGLCINPGFFLLLNDLPGEPLVVSALLVSLLNVHHFLMDGRIWRLRERKVVESFVATAAPM